MTICRGARRAPSRHLRATRAHAVRPHKLVVAILAVLCLVSQARPAHAQEAAPANTDTASYDIEARLDPATKQVHGVETIVYRNPSPDALTELWFKLYLNAFRSPGTLWLREAGSFRGVGYDPANPGWIRLERLVLAETGEDVLPPDAADAETVVRVPLPRPLGPGESVRLSAAWTSQLPRVFARTGFAGEFVMAGQWYPKLAVYDRGTWDREPWHANAEFFADFGTYTLSLTVPRTYVTGASGVREESTDNGDGTLTVRYRAERVSDVAWTAWPGYRVVTRAIVAAGQAVELELLTPAELDDADGRYLGAAEAALDLLGRWFGPYPWSRLTLVVPPPEAEGADGMEYPMLVTLGRPESLPFGLSGGVRTPELVTVHEIAHQWVPLQVATNEAREAWLDEGFADYATIRILAAMFGSGSSLLDLGPLDVGYRALHRLQYAFVADQPLSLASWEYAGAPTYAATVYSKGALALESLERTLGEERFLVAMRRYFDRWRWRHPTTADLQAALEEGVGERLDWFFDPLVYGRGVVEYRLVDAGPRRAVVERRGRVPYPVDVHLTYQDGRVEMRGWAADGERLELASDGPLARVEVDPERRISLELTPLDNSRVVEPAVPYLPVLARALALLQGALQLFGSFG